MNEIINEISSLNPMSLQFSITTLTVNRLSNSGMLHAPKTRIHSLQNITETCTANWCGNALAKWFEGSLGFAQTWQTSPKSHVTFKSISSHCTYSHAK